MIFLFIVAVFIIILLYNNNKLREENEYLKNKNNNIIRFCPKCGVEILNRTNSINCGHNLNKAPPNNTYENDKVNVVKKEKYTDKEIKNTLILIVGAVLVIISAIAFLASTWNTTGNFIKTLILFFMLIVFLGASSIADKKLNLKQTSKTFYYIALAYIPIIFLSISMFSLFGNYLSLNGAGKYIYLTISSIVVSLIYYFESKKKNSKTLFIFNVIFQLLSINLFVLNFTTKFSVILFGTTIYSIAISSLYLIGKIYFDKNIHKVLSIVLCFSISIILMFTNLINSFHFNIFIFDTFNFILILINLYLVLVKLLDKYSIYKFIYPIIIILIFNNLSYLFSENIMFMQSLILVSFAITYIYNILEEDKINIITYIEILVSFVIFLFVWSISRIFVINNNMMPNYILFGVMTILSLIYYMYNDKYKIFSSTMLAIGIIVTSITAGEYFSFDTIIIGIVAFTLIAISMIKNINKGLKTGFKWVGIIFLMLVSLHFVRGNYLYCLISYSLYSIIILIYGIITNDDTYKIPAYIYLNIVLLNIFDYPQLNYTRFVIPVTTIILTFSERIFNNIRSKASDIYLIISYIVSTIILLDTSSDYNNLVMLLLSTSFIYYIIYYKKNKNYLYVPFIGMIPHIYFNYDLVINNFNIMYVASILLITILGYLIYNKKSNIYIVMFYLYNFFHLTCLENIKYISIFLLMAGSYVCYLIKNNKVKDIYKALLYILGLVLYNTILVDLNLDYTSLCSMSYILVLILITRTILKKYSESYKIWEYIVSVIINFSAIGNFTSEYDGILYVLFLAILVIISYIYKFGPIFLISLISIIINSIILTQVIFGNIPWWLYILIIGGILIGFAIYNESRENDNNSIKKRLDL